MHKVKVFISSVKSILEVRTFSFFFGGGGGGGGGGVNPGGNYIYANASFKCL